jgi:glycosyltransferase involved in cell wall biosynthesis
MISRLQMLWRLCVLDVREWLRLDCRPLHKLIALGGLIAGGVLVATGQQYRALAVWCAIHRADYSGTVSRIIEGIIRRGRRRFEPAYRQHVDSVRPSPATARSFQPENLLGARAIVLKSPSNGERGVIVLHYSYAFPIFAKLFDMEQVLRRYHLVLESSWSGYCDLNLLAFTRFASPIVAEASEPRDAEFVRTIDSNLVVSPTSSNWWVDHRVFRPLDGVEKDVDVIMVGAWAHYKRHAPFFRALRTLRRRGRRLRVVLVGYALEMPQAALRDVADAHGVLDQIEWYENLTQRDVNHQLNRAKVSLIWSRKEGVNKAIIESLFADVPCVLRQGFNYGYHYPYVNSSTGCFSSERALPDTLERMVERHADFSPRAWVAANMSCQRAAVLLSDCIGDMCRRTNEPWSGGVAVKVNGLSAQEYWEPGDRERFEPDYRYLMSLATPNVA